MIHRSPLPAPSVPDRDLVGFVLEGAIRRGAHPALRDGDTGASISYGELPGLVGRVAAVLAGEGVGPGSPVVLVSANQPWWAVAFYAVLAAGGVVTPANPAATVEELARLVRASGASVVIADVDVAAKATEAAGDSVVLVIGTDGDDGLAARRRPGGASGAVVAPGPEALAVVPYSSGTTGPPKGVMLTHRNLVATVVQHAEVYHVGEGDVVLASLPLFHIYGMSIVLAYALRHGATVVTMRRFSAERFLALIADEGVTWLHLAPPTVLLLARADAGGHDLSSVRHAVSGAAPLDAGVQRRAEAVLGCRIGQGYGMTEASPGVTFVPDDRPELGPQGSVGVLVAGTEARVVDPATGIDVDDGRPGELWVRGPQVMAGYLDDPVATAATIVDGRWLRTGDIVRVDPAGVWWVVDRLKELIKYKGYQVAPAELEALLHDHPLVADAAVIGRSDAEAGEVPVGFVVRSAPSLTEADLLGWVAARVSPYKRLRDVVFVDALPKSASGKLLRRELRLADSGG